MLVLDNILKLGAPLTGTRVRKRWRLYQPVAKGGLPPLLLNHPRVAVFFELGRVSDPERILNRPRTNPTRPTNGPRTISSGPRSDPECRNGLPRHRRDAENPRREDEEEAEGLVQEPRGVPRTGNPEQRAPSLLRFVAFDCRNELSAVRVRFSALKGKP